MPCHTSYQIHTRGLSGAQRVSGSIHIQLRKPLDFFSEELLDTLQQLSHVLTYMLLQIFGLKCCLFNFSEHRFRRLGKSFKRRAVTEERQSRRKSGKHRIMVVSVHFKIAFALRTMIGSRRDGKRWEHLGSGDNRNPVIRTPKRCSQSLKIWPIRQLRDLHPTRRCVCGM